MGIMAPRIIDIAKAAAVSPSSVSLALNNKYGVSTEVRRKIITLAAQMGYKNILSGEYPANENVTIRLLKIAKHGHIVNERHNAFITEYLEGIEMGAKKKGYKLEVSFFDKMQIQDIVYSQRDISAQGLIVLGTELNVYELNFFSELPSPIVFIDTSFPLLTYDCVDMDNMDGVFRAIRYLYESGHRSIGLVKSRYETCNFKIREDGFRESMGYFSLPIQEPFIISVDPAFEESANDMNRYLKKHTRLPSAFFCMNDIIAYGCMKALREHNYRIPEDVSIIGFDDLPSSSLADPPLTTIRVSTHQIGQRAVEKLSDRIRLFSDSMPEKILIAGNLICRKSVRNI
jgi:LacI family transcriptional regulator